MNETYLVFNQDGTFNKKVSELENLFAINIKQTLTLMAKIFGENRLHIHNSFETTQAAAVIGVTDNGFSFRPIRIEKSKEITTMFRSKAFAASAVKIDKKYAKVDSLNFFPTLEDLYPILSEFQTTVLRYAKKYKLDETQTKTFASSIELFSRIYHKDRTKNWETYSKWLNYMAELTKLNHTPEMKIRFIKEGFPLEMVKATEEAPEEWINIMLKNESSAII